MGGSHSRTNSTSSDRSVPGSNGKPRRLSKPRLPLTASQQAAEHGSVASALTFARETLQLAGLLSGGRIRIHEHDDAERALRHCHAADLPSNISAVDDKQPPVAVLLLWGGLDLTMHQRGADEQSIGFELERIGAQLRPGGVVAFRSHKVDTVTAHEWMAALGLADVQLKIEGDAVTAFGRMPWQPRAHERLRVGLCLTEKKRLTFEGRFHINLDEAHVELIDYVDGTAPPPSALVDVVLCKAPVPPAWSSLLVVDPPARATVLDDRQATNALLVSALRNHAIKVPAAWTLASEARFPVIAKPNDAREHHGLFFAREAAALPAAPASGWFLQQMIPHDCELLKVSVIGQHVSCARRPSATSHLEAATDAAVAQLSRAADAHPRKGGIVASMAADNDDATVDEPAQQPQVPLPERKALELVARAIQHDFGVSMFGFDLVVSKHDAQYYGACCIALSIGARCMGGLTRSGVFNSGGYQLLSQLCRRAFPSIPHSRPPA